MSYRDADGIWQAGQPPNGLDLSDAQPKPKRAPWLSEELTRSLLNLSAEQLYSDPELVGACRSVDGALCFDGAVVAARAHQEDPDVALQREQREHSADAWLAEMRAQGIELGPFDGGKGAA